MNDFVGLVGRLMPQPVGISEFMAVLFMGQLRGFVELGGEAQPWPYLFMVALAL